MWLVGPPLNEAMSGLQCHRGRPDGGKQNNRENPITNARGSQPTSTTGRTTQDLSRDFNAAADPMNNFINSMQLFI